MPKKEKIILFNIVLAYLLYFVGFLIPEMYKTISDYLQYIIFFLCTSSFLLSGRKKRRGELKRLAPFGVLFALSIYLSISGFGSYLNLFNIVYIAYVTQRLSLSRESYKKIFAVDIGIFIALFICSLSVWDDFLLGQEIDNPNAIAQSLALCYGILFIGINSFVKDKKIRRSLYVLIFLLAVFGIYKCNSRGALATIMIMPMIISFNKIKEFVKKHFIVIASIIAILGTSIPFLYVNLYQNSQKIDLSFMSEKDFYTGRERIWSVAIEELEDNENSYLLGLGTHNETVIGEITNFHNWYLGSIYYFGIPLTVAMFFYLLYCFNRIKNDDVKIFVLMVLIFGFFETSILWSQSQLFYFAMLVFSNFMADRSRK